MLKAFLCLLVTAGCFFASAFMGGNTMMLVCGIVAAIFTVVFFIQGIARGIRGFINTHRRVRQAVDDERIAKLKRR